MRVTAILAATCAVTAPAPALAFQVETSVTDGCHERVTFQALDRTGWPEGREPPPLTDTDQRILDDLPFSMPDGGSDPWTLALLIGARHNDVRDVDPFDLAALTRVHDNPALQPEHCLRRKQDDGARGDEAALVACRAFIIGELGAALGDGEDIDMDARVPVDTHLVFRGAIELELARYPFHLGRALHALEDSYTHAFRNPADERVRGVLNWIEGNTGTSYEVARDGHAHIAALDECFGTDAAGDKREGWAIAAAAELVQAVNDPTGGRAGRLARAEAVLEAHMVIEPGCTPDNDWCGSPESKLSTGCSAAGGAGGDLAVWIALALLLAALGSRRGRGQRALLAVCAAALLRAAPAAADEAPPTPATPDEGTPAATPDTPPAPAADPGKTGPDAPAKPGAEAPGGGDAGDAPTSRSLEHEAKVIERMPDRVTRTWGAAMSVGASFSQGAGAVAAGGRWNPSDTIGLGLDVEYNPWFSISAADTAPGAASLYVPVTWRLKRFGTWDLRTTAYAGATMILFELVGVDRGTIGAFVGWNPLGLAMPLGPDLKLVIKPGDIAVSAPQLRGIPFYYYQYRFTIGLEWYP